MTTKTIYRFKRPVEKSIKGVVIKYDRVVVMTHNVCGIEWINANYYMKNKLVGVR